MNFHLEHHMFPLVPYHALPKLHVLIKDDTPRPTGTLRCLERNHSRRAAAGQRPRLSRQRVIRLQRPNVKPAKRRCVHGRRTSRSRRLDRSLLSRYPRFRGRDPFRSREETYAINRTADGSVYATDGICTHGKPTSPMAW